MSPEERADRFCTKLEWLAKTSHFTGEQWKNIKEALAADFTVAISEAEQACLEKFRKTTTGARP